MKRTTVSEELSHIEIGWLAGIIDGEGSLAHYYSKRKGKTKSGKPLKKSPMYGVVVVNNDEDIMSEVKKIYDKIGVYGNINTKSAYRNRQEDSKFKFTKPCYEIVVRRRLDVEKVLKIVTSHLIGYKKDKALKMLEHFKNTPFYARNLRAETKRQAP